MKKLFLVSACASLAIACSSSSNNTGSNRANSSATNTSVSTPSLNENAYTSASNSSLGTILKPSVGKTASEIKLWENKEIDRRLKKLMGLDYAQMKKFWNIETPIRKFGDFLMITGCEQHNCAENQYVIFMDTAEGNINAVHIGKNTTREWREHGYITLPPPFEEELAAMTSRK